MSYFFVSSNLTLVSLFEARSIVIFAITSLLLSGVSVLGFSHQWAQNHRNSRNSNRKVPFEKTVVIVYHKPSNIITSHSDAEALSVTKTGTRRTVYEDVQSMQGFVRSRKTPQHNKRQYCFEEVTGIRSKLHAVGRLDCETTGLLLLTNDGGLVHHVTNPKASSKQVSGNCNLSISKTYEAVIMGHHEDASPHFGKMRTEGVDIGPKHGGMTLPADDLSVLGHPTHKSTLVSITIREGRNRQVRRMFHSIGSGVMKLKRTRIGDSLSLDGLAEGQWRVMSEVEIEETLQWKVQRIEDKRVKQEIKRRQENQRKTTQNSTSHRKLRKQRRR